MRVLLLSAEYPPAPGGVGDYTLQLGLALRALDVDVHVATSPAPPAAEPLPRHPIRSWGWGLQRELMPLLRRLKPDLLHIQYQTGAFRMHPAVNLLPSALRALRPHPAVAVTCHDLLLPYLFPKADLLRRWVTWRLVHDADAVVVTNAEDAGRLRGELAGDRERFGAGRSLAPLVIPIGSNIAPVALSDARRTLWRQRSGAPEDVTLLGYFGLSNRSKGIDILLRALARLDPSYRLALIGGEAGESDPDNRRYAGELAALERELGLEGRVWRSGLLPAQEVSELLQSVDMALLPFRDGASYRRGSLLAALAHGLPVLTTQPPGPLDPPLRNGESALLLPRDEAALPEALAAAVLRVRDNVVLREGLRAGALALSVQFGWPEIARRHLELYGRLAG